MTQAESQRLEKPEFKLRQRGASPARGPLRLPESGFMRNFYSNAVDSRAAPFRGIRTNQPSGGELFPIKPTGISLSPLVKAGEEFLSSLSFAERTSCVFGVESDAWRSWCNFHSYLFRHGICLAELNDTQRGLAVALMQRSLSALGFETARNVMRLNQHLAELTGRSEEFGEWYYWISIMGRPSATEPWGWQIDGHHLIINCFVLGDQIVLTPSFMGSEPVSAESGPYAGTRVFAEEERLGLVTMQSLAPRQQATALIGQKLPFDVFAHAFADNLELDYQGIRYGELADDQKDHLTALIAYYIAREKPGHAAQRLAEVHRFLDDTYFAWIGAYDDVGAFYYRVHSPILLIEFVHQPGIMFANDEPSRRHAHTMVRTPNGNDYGKALLRQYYDRVSRAPLHASEPAPRETESIQRLGDPVDDLRRGG